MRLMHHIKCVATSKQHLKMNLKEENIWAKVASNFARYKYTNK